LLGSYSRSQSLSLLGLQWHKQFYFNSCTCTLHFETFCLDIPPILFHLKLIKSSAVAITAVVKLIYRFRPSLLSSDTFTYPKIHHGCSQLTSLQTSSSILLQWTDKLILVDRSQAFYARPSVSSQSFYVSFLLPGISRTVTFPLAVSLYGSPSSIPSYS
jgi:hypothetical protein